MDGRLTEIEQRMIEGNVTYCQGHEYDAYANRDPVFLAFLVHHLNALKHAVLGMGFDPRRDSQRPFSAPLAMALGYGHLESAQFLIEQCANVNEKTGTKESTPLDVVLSAKCLRCSTHPYCESGPQGGFPRKEWERTIGMLLSRGAKRTRVPYPVHVQNTYVYHTMRSLLCMCQPLLPRHSRPIWLTRDVLRCIRVYLL